MSIKTLTIGDPFFKVKVLQDEPGYTITGKTIVLNLSDEPIGVREQSIGSLQSTILKDTVIHPVSHVVVVEGFADHQDDEELMARFKT